MGPIPNASECRPGAKAVGFRLIVVVAPVQDKTSGGIILPDSAKDKDKLVQVRGRIVSMGSTAFDYAHFPTGTVPQEGDAVMFAKLAGYMFDGEDGKEYRILHDKDISAVLEEAA